MKHVCAAYFNKSSSECIQTIEEHVKDGVIFLKEVYLERGFDRYIVRLARLLKVSISRKEALRALYASYIFHDLGKLELGYQQRRASFGGHEVISAYWIERYGKGLGLEEMLYPVVYAIFLHHHDIQKSKPEKIMNVRLCNDCLKLLLSIYRERTLVNLTDYDVQFMGDVCESLKEKFCRFSKDIDHDFRYFRLSYPLLEVIHSADNYSAKKRGGEKTVLSQEIQKVYNAINSLKESYKY
jgi:CRISPR-associated endonuclease Cas3-HD